MAERTASGLIELSRDVAAALAERRPVVALESVVIAHGLPYPTNLEVARRMEAAVREAGALPATVWARDGRLRIGAQADEIEYLATQPGIRKVSRRDLPIVLGRREPGATTVAATLIIAHQAGIPIAATGGIGAVAHGGERSWDVSNDLAVLAQCPMALVCAGAKSLMDARLTRELLETLGVTVLGWQTDELPAFYTRGSGERVDARVDTGAEAAAIVAANRSLELPGAVLITVPPPPEIALSEEEAREAVARALASAAAAGQSGADLTPYVLAALADLTGGRSRDVNAALLVLNARIAGEIAVALANQAVGHGGRDA